jgi:hypothetical protein
MRPVISEDHLQVLEYASRRAIKACKTAERFFLASFRRKDIKPWVRTWRKTNSAGSFRSMGAINGGFADISLKAKSSDQCT